MSQAFYRKWRPKIWDDVVGQQHITSTLRNAVTNQRVAHAYLFAGPRGTGKTSSARLLAKAVNCLAEDLAERPCNQCDHCKSVNQGRFLDLIEIDAASNTSVDDVRDLRDKINFSPNLGRFKVYIIDEVHMLSTAAFNALLKTLEEPPSHAIFILATTEVHKIPATVLSRCQRHEFRRIPVSEIVTQLQLLAEGESLTVADEALTLVARQATGSLRDAISLLDQLASTQQEISLEMAQAVLGTVASQAVLDLIDAVQAKDLAQGLDLIHQTLDTGSDPRQFARQIVEYLRDVVLVQMGNAGLVDTTREAYQRMAAHGRAFEGGELLGMIKAFNHAASEARVSWQPALPLEMAFLDATRLFDGPLPAAQGAGPAPVAQTTPKIKSPPAAKRTATAKPEPTPAPQAAPVEETDSLPQNIAQNWDKIKAVVRQHNPQTQALLNSSKPLGIKDGALFLAFNGEFAKSKMDQDEHLEIVTQAIEQILGTRMQVRCVLAAGTGSIPTDIDQDGMVATALRDLGGEIVDIH